MSNNNPTIPDKSGDADLSSRDQQARFISAQPKLLSPPTPSYPQTPIRGRERLNESKSPAPRIAWQPSVHGPRIETSCADCSGDELCPLHDFISEDYEHGLHSDTDHNSSFKSLVRTPVLSRKKQRPKLRLQTPGKVQERQVNASEGKEGTAASLKRPEARRHATDDSMGDSLPSGSTLLGSGSTPGSVSKKWEKQIKTVSFAAPSQRTDDTAVSTPTRPLLPRSSSSQSSQGNGERLSARKRMQRIFFFKKFPSESYSPSPRNYTDRRHTEVQTPLQLPRRVSRLPSFFTRERLILPTRVQRRDFLLLSVSLTLSTLFTTVGVLATVVPTKICHVGWLATAIDSFLPNLAISTPYTLLVVGFAVSNAGRHWINGRYTPLLYALVAALGRVAVGALSGNISWRVMHCPGGNA